MNELFAAARDFYNMTVADPEVKIRTADESRRDQITAASERLRAILSDHAAAAGLEEQCCDTPAYCSSVRRCTANDTPRDERKLSRGFDATIDSKALATAQEIALIWGNDRGQFVSRIQIAVIEAMRWMITPAAPVGGFVVDDPERDKLVGALLDEWELKTPWDLKCDLREDGIGKRLDALLAHMNDPEPRT